MAKTIKNSILFIFILIFTCQSAFCYVLTSSELSEILTGKLEKEAAEKLNLKEDDAEIKIKISDIPFNSITTKTQNPKIELLPTSSIQPDTLRRITIKNPDNTIVKVFSVNVKTSVIKEVLTASEDIQFNKEITLKNTKLAKADILRNRSRVLTAFEDGLIAKRNYRKGSIIFADYIKPKAEVSKNSVVDIVFIANGIRIKLQGRALKEGNIGDTILVRSDKYNKVYNAKINSSNEVAVKI